MKPLKYLCVFLFFIVLFGLSPFGGVCGVSAAYTWTNDIVDNGGTSYHNDVGSYSSIVVDTSGKLHISYGGISCPKGSLFYATNSSGSWVTEIIHKQFRLGYYTSLAIDSSGKLHISFHDNMDGSLKYTTNSSGKWVTQVIDSNGFAGRYSSIAIDSSDKVHISYCGGIESNSDLKYATNASGSWVIEALEKAKVGWSTSIALDSSDKVHISYHDWYRQDLKYATNVSGEWRIERLDSSGRPGIQTSIAIDAFDNVHICSVKLVTFSEGITNLEYISNISGVWTKEIIDKGSGATDPSLALDAFGNAHISYSTYRSNTKYRDLNYISNASGSWVKETVVRGENARHTSIALDSLGQIHISYYEYIKRDLKYATNKSADVASSPPTTDAGDNITVASEDQNKTVIDGTATDPDNDPLVYRWLDGDIELSSWQDVGENGSAVLNLAEIEFLSRGEHTLTLEVSDGETTVADQMVLTIDNSSPQAVASGAGTFQIGDPAVLSGEVSDYDGDWITYKWLINGEIYSAGEVETIPGGKPVSIPECTIWGMYIGTYTVSLVVNDGINDPVFKDMTIEVIDTIAPSLAPSADKNILWPPNHKMVDVVITANAADNSGGIIHLYAEISSSESDNGAGDGNTESDWEIIEVDDANGIIYLQLRAERSGTSDERRYTVTITAADASDNSSSVDMEFIVPHDKGKR